MAAVNALSNRTSFVHDAIGRQVRVVNPLGKIATNLYDDANRVRATLDPLGNRTTFGYNAADQRVTMRDAANNVTTSVYEATGTPVATIDALAGRTTQVFDSAGRRTALVDAKGNRTTFGFDDSGRNVMILDAIGNRTTWSYDAVSQQRFRIDGRGNRTTYAHDDAGRLTSRRYPDASRVTFAFDALGQRNKMHDSNGRTTYTFDDVQRLRTVVNPANKKLTYSYDAIGQRRFLIEPDGGRFTTSYDDAGRIRFLVNPQNYRTTWSYDAADRVKVQYLGNTTRASYSYDDANRVLKLANIRSDSTTISSFDYAYDSVGNRTRVIESDGIRVSWSYDNKYQLTREQRNGGNAYDITYSYDPAGNRRVKLEDAIRTTCAYDAANQLRYTEDNTGRTTYTFDANGNQRIVKTPAGALTTNTWDYENKLTKVVLPSGTRNTFAYDANGKRVKKEDSSGTSKFVWDAQNILVETNSSDVIQAVYSQEPVVYGNLISQYRSATTNFFHFDALGSTDRLTNSLGVISDSYVYKAFGIIAVSSGTTVNPLRFVGRLGYYYDSDLMEYYLRARFYDPRLGRFLSHDSGWDAVVLYAYTQNRPVILVDASGRKESLPGILPTASLVLAVVAGVDNNRIQLCIDAFPSPKLPGYPPVKSPELKCFAKCLLEKDPRKIADCFVDNCFVGLIGKDPKSIPKELLYAWMASILCCNTFTKKGGSVNPCNCGYQPAPKSDKPKDDKPKGEEPKWKCLNPLKDPQCFKRQDVCWDCCEFTTCVQLYSKMNKLGGADIIFGGLDNAGCKFVCAGLNN